MVRLFFECFWYSHVSVSRSFYCSYAPVFLVYISNPFHFLINALHSYLGIGHFATGPGPKNQVSAGR